MNVPKYRYFMCDFETTVYKGQVNTEVWAAACVELYTEEVHIFHSIGEQFEFFKSLNCSVMCYYHNLKFDGAFWLSYLMTELELKQAYDELDETHGYFLRPRQMKNRTFSYSISSMGQWYKILIKIDNHYIEIRDSLKLLPFSVEKLGKSFGTKHKKLHMEYEGFRYAGCEITPDERQYISNDILVVKEALEIAFNEGHKRLTIGSCCLEEYKQSIGKAYYNRLFPDLYKIEIDKEAYGYDSAGAYIHAAYHGGWCYLAKGKEKQLKRNGITIDVNSLYPSMMSSESGNRYPTGEPIFWSGNYIPDEALAPDKYFYVRITCRFYIRDGKLPFIQVKNTLIYKTTEMLETSDIYNYDDGRYYPEYIDFDGSIKPATVTMVMTQTDFQLLKEHYELVDFIIHDGCYFNAAIGIFDAYIDKYKHKKLTSKGAQRELAKLFLNNLYGKMASSPASNFKVAYLKEDKVIGFNQINANDKKPGYIAVGAAITSYARNFTIRAAQQNYYGADKPGFIYADTDSIHCDLPPDKIKGVSLHDKNFCCWKLEGYWDTALFVRQKTYIEHIIEEDGEKLEKPYYSLKCAGMPEKCKNLFLKSVEGYEPKEGDNYTEDELDFLSTKRELTDFDVGLRVPGKLMPKRIRGGVLLVDTTYEMR